ncbi:hypothetical protein BH11PLA1_BH11PLA1_23900 [soil metagenome]
MPPHLPITLAFAAWVPDLAWTIAAAVVAVAALVALTWALRGDRARGRRRCPRCWYDLSAVGAATPEVPTTCPECGRIITRAAHLLRPRRRRKTAAAALLALLAAALCAITPAVRADGWLGASPSWILRAWARAAPHAWADDAAVELEIRIATGDITARGELLATYAALRDRLVTYRHTWVRGQPIPVRSGLLRVHPRDAVVDGIRAAPAGGPAGLGPSFNPMAAAETAERWWMEEPALRVRPVEDARSATIALYVVAGDQLRQRAEPTGTPTFRLPITLRATAEECIDPVSTPALDAAVAAYLHPRLARNAVGGADAWGVSARPDLRRPESLRGVALGIRIELLRAGAVVAAARWRDSAEDRVAAFSSPPSRFEVVAGASLSGLAEVDESSPVWRVRILGDAAAALHDPSAEKYWSGTFELTLKQFLGAEPKEE